MDSTGFTGFAIFVVLAVITGAIGLLAVQQSKLRRQIEETRRERERAELATLGGIDPTVTDIPPVITPGGPAVSAPDTTPTITPGATPHHPHSTPDAGPSPGGFDAGGHHGGGFDGGGGGGHH
jgi:hypothetical protein